MHLTPTESGMLEVLVRNRGKLVGREELLREVWGPAYAKETHPVHLLTETGMGYRFQA